MIRSNTFFITFFILSLSMVTQVQSNTDNNIDIDSLGQLQLDFKTIELVKSYEGRTVKAIVSYKPGEAFKIVAPFSAQSIQWLVENGQFVRKGKPILILSGSEVHHFLEMLEAQKAIFELAAQRFEKNKKLFKQKSISSDKWASISTDYYQAKIEYGHLRHFREYIDSIKHEDSIVIKAIIDGLFLLPNDLDEPTGVHSAEMQLGQILPRSSLRLKVQVSTSTANSVKSVSTGSCSINIDQNEQVSRGYFVSLWSQTIPDNCQLLLGQTLQATPNLLTDAYRVPQSSVFTWQRSSYILVKKQSQLIPIVVDIVSSGLNGYLIQSAQDLSGSEVLFSSVSAVHGILLGMGGE